MVLAQSNFGGDKAEPVRPYCSVGEFTLDSPTMSKVLLIKELGGSYSAEKPGFAFGLYTWVKNGLSFPKGVSLA